MRCFSAIWWNENEGWRWTTCRVFLRVCLCLIGDLKHSHDKSLLLSHTTFTQSSCHGFLSESIWHPGMFPLNTVLWLDKGSGMIDWLLHADCDSSDMLHVVFVCAFCPVTKCFMTMALGRRRSVSLVQGCPVGCCVNTGTLILVHRH